MNSIMSCDVLCGVQFIAGSNVLCEAQFIDEYQNFNKKYKVLRVIVLQYRVSQFLGPYLTK